jgi:hypothetical protein
VTSVKTAPLLVVAGGGGGGGGFGALNGASQGKENDQGGAGGAGGNIGGQGVNGRFSPGPGEAFGGGGGGHWGIAYGGPPAFAPGGGGGGGWSTATVSDAVSDVAFLSGGPGAPNLGVAPGLNGSVVLTTNEVQGFTAGVHSFNPPAGTTQMTVYLEGASGGHRFKSVNIPLNGALGSPGGSTKATFPFVPTQQPYFVIVSGYGNHHGGGGFGEGGDQGQVGDESLGFDGGGVAAALPSKAPILPGDKSCCSTPGAAGVVAGMASEVPVASAGLGATGMVRPAIKAFMAVKAAQLPQSPAITAVVRPLPRVAGPAAVVAVARLKEAGAGDGGAGIPVLGTGAGGGGGGSGDCFFDGSAIDPTFGFGSVVGDGIGIVTFIADSSIAVLQPVLAKPIAMHGQARNIGDGNPDGVVRIEGKAFDAEFFIPRSAPRPGDVYIDKIADRGEREGRTLSSGQSCAPPSDHVASVGQKPSRRCSLRNRAGGDAQGQG